MVEKQKGKRDTDFEEKGRTSKGRDKREKCIRDDDRKGERERNG